MNITNSTTEDTMNITNSTEAAAAFAAFGIARRAGEDAQAALLYEALRAYVNRHEDERRARPRP